MATKQSIFEEHLESWLKVRGDKQKRREINGELARRLKDAIDSATLQVVIEMLVKFESNRRMSDRATCAIQATYDIDPAVISSRADAMEAEARANLAQPEEDAGPMDETDDEVETSAEELEDGGHAMSEPPISPSTEVATAGTWSPL